MTVCQRPPYREGLLSSVGVGCRTTVGRVARKLYVGQLTLAAALPSAACPSGTADGWHRAGCRQRPDQDDGWAEVLAPRFGKRITLSDTCLMLVARRIRTIERILREVRQWRILGEFGPWRLGGHCGNANVHAPHSGGAGRGELSAASVGVGGRSWQRRTDPRDRRSSKGAMGGIRPRQERRGASHLLLGKAPRNHSDACCIREERPSEPDACAKQAASESCRKGVRMKKDMFDELMESVRQGGKILRGAAKPSRKVREPSRRAFASSLRAVPVRTGSRAVAARVLRGWPRAVRSRRPVQHPWQERSAALAAFGGLPSGMPPLRISTVRRTAPAVNWEQGRRKPHGAARVLLRVAAEHPDAVWDTIKKAS
jgi:hypothetical protein